jgi:hypothetical protein
VHICAVSGHFGRGYYNVHPLLFEDFYLQNGCDHVVSTYRTKYRPRGMEQRLARLLRRDNTIWSTEQAGNVYLASASAASIRFANAFPADGEVNLIPNNVLGVFAFRKRERVTVRMPLRTAPYDAKEQR